MVRECEVIVNYIWSSTEVMVHGYNVYKGHQTVWEAPLHINRSDCKWQQVLCQRCMHRILILKNVTRRSLHIDTCVHMANYNFLGIIFVFEN